MVGVGECGSSCGVLCIILSPSCEASSSASDESSAHTVIGDSFGLNGGLVSGVVVGVWADVDELLVMEGDGGESRHTLLTLLPLLLKAMTAAESHFGIGGILLLGCGGGNDRLSSLLLLKTVTRASFHVGIFVLVVVDDVGVSD